jgi:hypothetical protein
MKHRVALPHGHAVRLSQDHVLKFGRCACKPAEPAQNGIISLFHGPCVLRSAQTTLHGTWPPGKMARACLTGQDRFSWHRRRAFQGLQRVQTRKVRILTGAATPRR